MFQKSIKGGIHSLLNLKIKTKSKFFNSVFDMQKEVLIERGVHSFYKEA